MVYKTSLQIIRTIIFSISAMLSCVLVNAQNYEIEFSVNKENATAIYKIKNCTEYDLYLIRTHDANLSAGCHCAINYENKDGHSQYEILCTTDKRITKVMPDETYIYNVNFNWLKDKEIKTINGVFCIIYNTSTEQYIRERIERNINF